jgi:hypothetical protein
LEVELDARQVDDRLDASVAELVGVNLQIFSVLFCLSPTDREADIPIPDRWRIRGDDKVLPGTTTCLRVRKTRICGRFGLPGQFGSVGHDTDELVLDGLAYSQDYSVDGTEILY